MTLSRWYLLIVVLLCAILMCLSVEDHAHERNMKYEDSRLSSSFNPENLEVMHLAVAACGEDPDRFEETVTLLKAAAVFSKGPLKFHIFADDNFKPQFEKELASWPSYLHPRVAWDIQMVRFPKGKEAAWKKLFKLCASQRVFLPTLLEDVQRLIYVDTDILFLRPVDDIWAFFDQFNSTHLAVLAEEHLQHQISWYSRHARHPYYHPYGLNSGVMLMDLERMRDVGWTERMADYYEEYKLKIPWGDQDLINIFFHDFPEKVLLYTCDWNYRPDFCMYTSHCPHSHENGISVVHGNRRVYHNEKQPAFKAVYRAMRDYKFGQDPVEFLWHPIKEQMKWAEAESKLGVRMNCGKVTDIFIKQLKTQIKPLRERLGLSTHDEL